MGRAVLSLERDRSVSKLWRPREPFCGLSHLVGAILAIAGTMLLLVVSYGKPWQMVSFAIYGSTLIALYSSSALYHSLYVSEDQQSRLQQLDYACIFLLIAGTYTPVCLVTLHGAIGWSLLAAEYAVGIVGMLVVLLWKGAPDWLRLVFYLVMGWLVVPTLPRLEHALSPTAMAWLVAGGVTYTVGAAVYAARRPNLIPGKFGYHDLWHVFVLGGSACHFVMMLNLVAG